MFNSFRKKFLHPDPSEIFTFLAWIGMILILSAYFSNSYELLSRDQIVYHLMNGFGGLFLGMDAYRRKAYYIVVLEIVWVSIALTSIGKILFF